MRTPPYSAIRVLVFCLKLGVRVVFAADIDSASMQGVIDTKAMLSDPTARKKIIEQDGGARAADANLKGLGLSAGSQEAAYRLSSEITEKFVRESGGDAILLQRKMNELLRDPASLEGALTPEQRAEIHRLGQEIERPAAKTP